MAKTTLPTNYVDDVLNGAMDGKRRYREIPNADGTISLEDATTYDQIGSNFGASQLNLMNENINQSFDANKMLKTMDEVNAVTQEGYGVDALVVKQVNDSLAKFMEAMGYDPNRISLVPIMTSNSLPEGTVLFSAENATSSTPRRGYHAFDGDSDTFWATTGGTSAWIGYMFTENVKVSRVMVLTNGSGLSAIVRYSDNGTSWNNITSSTALSQNVENYIDVSHVNSHKYWSLSLSASATSTFNIKTLQFYGTKNA